MAVSGWSFIAQRLTGDGAGEFLDFDVDLTGPQLTDRLSGPLGLDAQIEPVMRHLIADDKRLLFEPWGTAIFPEADGEIQGGYILTGMSATGPKLDLEFTSFVGYAKDQPYDGSIYFIDEDPLNIFRHGWAHLQGHPGGNLGLQVASTTSPVRVGKQIENVEFQTSEGENVAFEAGPVKLNYWTTEDLGGELDKLATETPFDYHERHVWNPAKTEITHHLDLGYPQLGRTRDDLMIVLGENGWVLPNVILGEDYANHAIGLGAGEGRDMVRSSTLSYHDGRLRRVVQEHDKSARSIKAATEIARRRLAKSRGLAKVTEIAVTDHSNARLRDLTVGDTIRFQAETGWQDVDQWCRIVSKTIDPARGDSASLTVVLPEEASL